MAEPDVPMDEPEILPPTVGPHEEIDEKAARSAKEAGNTAFQAGNLALAVTEYTKGIRMDTRDPACFSNRALCRLRLKQLQGALEDATSAIWANSMWAKAWGRRASVLLEMGRAEDALQSVGAALLLEPDSAVFKGIVTEIEKHIPHAGDLLKHPLNLTVPDPIEELRRTLAVLGMEEEGRDLENVTEEQRAKLAQKVSERISRLKKGEQPEFDRKAEQDTVLRLQKRALASVRAKDQPRGTGKWVISCSSIGRSHEETGAIEWMSQVVDMMSGECLAADVCYHFPTPRVLQNLLQVAMVFPMGKKSTPQIPNFVYFAHRLRRVFHETRDLAHQMGVTSTALQERSEERRMAEMAGTDPDGYDLPEGIEVAGGDGMIPLTEEGEEELLEVQKGSEEEMSGGLKPGQPDAMSGEAGEKTILEVD